LNNVASTDNRGTMQKQPGNLELSR
jgi:hypothetical protein